MQFVPDQTVIHPHHGPGIVRAIVTRKVRGVPVEYADLEVIETGLRVGVPIAKAEEIGIRPPLGPEAIEEVFAVLTGETGEVDKQWSRRIKDEWQKVMTGAPNTVASVIRDLTRRDAEEGISMAERDLLRDARQPVVAEVKVCFGCDTEEAESILNRAILEHIVPAGTSIS